MAKVLKTTFQLRRGYESAWEKNNPVLAQGEPGFVIDKNAFKIGDGATAWNDLEYISGGVFNAKTHSDFPENGFANIIYKAEDEKKIYQWNTAELRYEVLNEIDIPEGFSGSWNDLKDKPFDETISIIYDLTTLSEEEFNSLERVEIDGGIFRKISDNVDGINLSDGFNCNVFTFDDEVVLIPNLQDGDNLEILTAEFAVMHIKREDSADVTHITVFGGQGTHKINREIYISLKENAEFNGMQVPKGIYTTSIIGRYGSIISLASVFIKKIDEKFVPDVIARISDIPELPEIPVTSVNGQTGDIEIDIPDHTWESLPDKPFSKDVYTITNETDYFVPVEGNPNVGKISDMVVPHEYLIGAEIEFQGTKEIITQELFDMLMQNELITDDFAWVSEAAIMIYTAGTVIQGLTFPEIGTYSVPAETAKLSITWEGFKTLDEHFIPDTIARVEDMPEVPVTSVNGKTGAVQLIASDVGALPDTTVIPSIEGLATETYVNNKVAGLVDSAPETLNTLNELAAALGEDPNFATTVATQIGTLESKVGDISVSEQINNAIANIEIPTVPTKISAFENDKGYLTQHQSLSGYAKISDIPTKTSQLTNDSNFATETYVDNKVSNIDLPSGFVAQKEAPTDKTVLWVDMDDETDETAGITPVRGVDYWTQDDISYIISEVVDSIKVEHPEVHVIYGDVDANNTITIYGELAEGIYMLKYEDEDGNVIEVGTIKVTAPAKPNYTNLADSTDPAWITDKRYNSSNVLTDFVGGVISNYIDVSGCKSHIAIKGINLKGENGRAYVYGGVADAPTTFINTTSNGSITTASYDSSVYIIPASVISGYSNKLWRFGGLLVGNAEDVVIVIDEDIKDGEPSYTNQIPISIDSDGSVYNSTGYKTATRLNSSGDTADVHNTSASNPVFLTGFIPVKTGDIIRMKNCYADYNGSDTDVSDLNYFGSELGNLRFWTYHDTFGCANQILWSELLTSSYITAIADSNGHVTEFTYNATAPYIRLCLAGDPATAIVTVNEEITDGESINWLWNGIDTDGAIFNNGAGWIDGYRLNSSGVESESDGMSVTGFIPVKVGDVVTVENAVGGGKASYAHIYDSEFNWIKMLMSDEPNPILTIVDENAAYFRMTARFYQNSETRPDTVITIV